MTQINIHEAKTHLSQLLFRAVLGEDIIIAKAGKPIVRLVPIEKPLEDRVLGQDEGLFTVPEDFNAPLPEDILSAFEGGTME
ncbi:type II toxin-antitoxin system Phd/YefM family antitoxin [Myxosarcina sp. GI1]|uniref:type II toxin-antitoxin system Phd/YefM family antitoxin n=1 Tax=Myxosarcina sp. GI1 TaxID=1541065 RepID=UPI00056742BE|nr:type II toxin-antitoxin system Phd/YefM family antitoxin [Myxosarcina sp. GI1]